VEAEYESFNDLLLTIEASLHGFIDDTKKMMKIDKKHRDDYADLIIMLDGWIEAIKELYEDVGEEIEEY